jgi:hypothetical protein
VLVVLHALRVKGLAEVDDVAVATGRPVAEVEATCAALRADGLAQYRQGRVSGWGLTSAGRARDAEVTAAELAGVDRDCVEACYRRFLPLNKEMLAACTDWQIKEVGDTHVLNDHADAAYDDAVRARLYAAHETAEPLLADLADTLPRFAPYRPRLANAVARVRAGEHDWFAQPRIDSFHTVWFELHEDLLSTLGLERSKEEPT